jgi:hypothetical protein
MRCCMRCGTRISRLTRPFRCLYPRNGLSRIGPFRTRFITIQASSLTLQTQALRQPQVRVSSRARSHTQNALSTKPRSHATTIRAARASAIRVARTSTEYTTRLFGGGDGARRRCRPLRVLTVAACAAQNAFSAAALRARNSLPRRPRPATRAPMVCWVTPRWSARAAFGQRSPSTVFSTVRPLTSNPAAHVHAYVAAIAHHADSMSLRRSRRLRLAAYSWVEPYPCAISYFRRSHPPAPSRTAKSPCC